MGKALYRHYRPRALGEVIGQEHITQTLARALKAGRVSHAYLFTGPRGTGKTSVARILAHEINNLPYSDTPHLDILEIDAASNRRIDDIRDLREKIHITPSSARYKVYIIDEVHMLTGESFNALLKTLEEPPAHVVFILATTEAHKVPSTIISRTQRFTFRPVSYERVAAHLGHIATQESIAVTPDALALIAEHGEGSFRDSISLLDQLAHSSTGEIDAAHVAATLGLAPQTNLQSLINAINSGDRTGIAALLAETEAAGVPASTLSVQISKALLAEAAGDPHIYPMLDALLEVPRAYDPSLKLLTTLMLHLPPASPQKAEPKQKLPPATKEEKTPLSAPKPKPKPEKPANSAATAALPASLNPHDWAAILAATKQASPPLFAVLKLAQPVIADGTLTLAFKYSLHSKKLNDANAKAKLAEIAGDVLGAAPAITVRVDPAASPLVIPPEPELADIAVIMGGGEIIPHAEAI